MFKGSKDEVCYGDIRAQPIIFQDDIIRMNDDVLAASAGNIKLNMVMSQKQLKFIGYILMGGSEVVDRTRGLLSKSPLLCGQFETK